MRDAVAAVRTAAAAVRGAFRNDGIRRLAISWTLGIGADAALGVVTLVAVFNLGGVVAAGLLGAVRMVPAVASGMLASAMLDRVRADRFLVVLGLVRATCAALTAVVIATEPAAGGAVVTIGALFVLQAVASAAAAPIRPTQITLMPALARSPAELVAANAVWSTGEATGAFVGPFVAGVLMAFGQSTAVAVVAAVAFLVTAWVAAGLRFEQTTDILAARTRTNVVARLREGVRAVARRPVLLWSNLGAYFQVLTRGLLNALVVVAAIELLGMGEAGAGLLGAALGLGGLVGAVFAMSSSRPERLVRTEVTALIFWGLPIALIGLIPMPAIALAAMVVVGVANATYDVTLFTIIQRGSRNDERAAVLSVLEGVIGAGLVSGSLLAPLLTWAFGARGALVVTSAILPIVAVVIFARIGRAREVATVDDELTGLLRRVPSFAELPMTAVERLAAGLVPVAAPAGSTLMTEGETGDTFIVLSSGEVEVSVGDRPIHRLGPGNGVGEIALVRRSPRTATVVALTDVTGYSVEACVFLAAVAGPAAAAATERMAEANLRRGAAALAPVGR
ncbi:MAG TPA: cyclic nucleotide-binding domain-containing protein [Candidatus Limnocylindrales bacterium]